MTGKQDIIFDVDGQPLIILDDLDQMTTFLKKKGWIFIPPLGWIKVINNRDDVKK